MTYNDNGISADFIGSGLAGADESYGAPVMTLDGADAGKFVGTQNLANDAAGGIHPYGTFTETLNEVVRTQYQPLTAEKMFPIRRTANIWMDKLRLHTLTGTGEAKIVCGCDANFPTVSLEGCTYETGVVTLGAGYQVCYQTMMQQESTPGLMIDYEQELLDVAFRALQEKANHLAFFGDIKRNVLGVLNNPYVPSQFSPYRLDDAVSDPQAIVRVIQAAASANRVRNRGASRNPDTMALPPSLLNYLRGRFANTADGGCCDTNLLEKIQAAAPYLQYIIEVPELEEVGPGCDRAIFFYRRDRRSIEWNFPSALHVPPPEFHCLKKTVYLMARVGSVWNKYPDDSTLLLGV